MATTICFGMLITANSHAYAAQSEISAGQVTTSSTNLNVRLGAGTGYSVVASLAKGSMVTLISKSGDWWQVEYSDGKTGYCHKDYISQISTVTATVNTESTNLNVRSGAGTNYSIVGSLAKGKQVVILSESGGWSKVLYAGTDVGYASSSYLKKASAYSSVALSVSDFKQTDSRWANVTLGSSGKTIGSVGCTTTAIAMMESYRTGTTIYPDAMSKKLSYSSSGNLYWPSNYLNDTSSSGYLEKIYNLLASGKPVLMGAKNSSGKQHWVVVKGFGGGDSLSASQFTINDPETSSRTNLQQFLNEYPTFYKLVYYN